MTNQTHTGRFAFDDKVRKWLLRIFAAIGVLATLFVILLAVGLYHLAT